MRRSRTARPAAVWAERLLAFAGSVALLYCAGIAVEAHEAMRESQAFTTASGPATTADAVIENGTPAREVIGQIEISALRLKAPIVGGIADWELKRGVGHLPGTAMPGGLGTMGLAGHRDTFFRALENVRPQMEIRVAAADGHYRYVVDSTEIVSPEQVDVVATRMRPELTLITCYPFHYIGAAPQRFIVHAHLVSVAGD